MKVYMQDLFLKIYVFSWNKWAWVWGPDRQKILTKGLMHFWVWSFRDFRIFWQYPICRIYPAWPLSTYMLMSRKVSFLWTVYDWWHKNITQNINSTYEIVAPHDSLRVVRNCSGCIRFSKKTIALLVKQISSTSYHLHHGICCSGLR